MKKKKFHKSPDEARAAVREDLYHMDCTPGVAGAHGEDQPQRRKTAERWHAPTPESTKA